jgi:hypothetical protein
MNGKSLARRASSRIAAALSVAVAFAALAPAAEKGAGRPHKATTQAPEPDSITSGLWHFDEGGGIRAADAGPFRLDGTAGKDTRTDFGRMRSARVFTRSVESFVFVPYSPALEQGSGLTVEAWVYLNRFGDFEDTPIAGRWTALANGQSWLFSVVGRRLEVPVVAAASPGDHRDLVFRSQTGQLLFAFQPGPASAPLAFTSNTVLELERWTHVAVTFDGVVVRFFIDGRAEAQYAAQGPIRHSTAPLMVGNAIDPRYLSDFAGDLSADALPDRTPYYAFDGMIDELRISSAARAAIVLRR